MTKTQQREREEFIAIMLQEFPCANGFASGALLDTCDELMRLARWHGRLQEKACNVPVPDNHDTACEERIRAVCREFFGEGVVPVFSGDPRGCTVKLRIPSGRTNDWGATGICVPQ